MQCRIDAGQHLENRSLINSTTKTLLTPLHSAILGGQWECVKVLCKAGADIEAQSNSGKTPLQRATEKNNVDMVKYLLDLSANVNKGNKTGITSLHIAASKGFSEIVGILLESAADVNAQSDEAWTPMHMSIKAGHSEVTSILIAYGSNVHSEIKTGDSPIHIAAECGDSEILEHVLNLDGMSESTSSKNNKGHIPLHSAARKGNLNCVSLLMPLGLGQGDGEQDGPLVNKEDAQGKTPLHLAVEGGFSPVIEALVEFGANINIQTNDGKTCLHLAVTVWGSSDKTVQDTTGFEQVSIVHPEYQTLTTNEKLIVYLLDRGANYEIFDSSGYTPIHYACNKIWQLLVLRGFVDDETWQQITALRINRVKKTRRGKRAGRQHRDKVEKLSMKLKRTHLNTDFSSKNIKFAMLNARSVKNKTAEFVDYILDHELDIVAVCETWLTPNDADMIGQLTPCGFTFKHIPRAGKRGGGVAVLFKSQLDVRILDSPNITSFEMIQMSLNHKQKVLHLINVYRPPTPTQFQTFLEEFSNVLDGQLLCSSDLSTPTSKSFSELLTAYNMV
nr:ankyrin-3-like [Lytechinus pictus]